MHPSILVPERKTCHQLSSWGIIINRFLSLEKDMMVSLEVPNSFNILISLRHMCFSHTRSRKKHGHIKKQIANDVSSQLPSTWSS